MKWCDFFLRNGAYAFLDVSIFFSVFSSRLLNALLRSQRKFTASKIQELARR